MIKCNGKLAKCIGDTVDVFIKKEDIRSWPDGSRRNTWTSKFTKDIVRSLLGDISEEFVQEKL